MNDLDRTSRRGKFLIGAIMVAAFGPYTPVPGLRTEQAAVYTTAALCLIAAVIKPIKVTASAAAVGALLAVQLSVALVGGLFPPFNTSKYQIGSVVAGLDNVALPLAVVLIVVTLASRGVDTTAMLRVACTVLVVAMCVNAVVAAASAQIDMSGFLSHFWDNQTDIADSAFHRAATGRYVGLINMPAQAGELYGLALIAAVYLLRRSPGRLVVAASLITAGGILAVSKTFLFVGLTVGGWQLLRWGARRPARLVLAGMCIVGGYQAISYALRGATRGNSLWTYLSPDAGVGTITAGRFGGTSTLAPVVDAVMTDSPWFGYGAGRLNVALDNGWIEALTAAGLVGVLAFTLASVVLAVTWWRRRGKVTAEWSRLSIGTVLVANGAAVGMPGLTSNRIATVVWMLLSLLLLTPRAASYSRARKDPLLTAPGGTVNVSPVLLPASVLCAPRYQPPDPAMSCTDK